MTSIVGQNVVDMETGEILGKPITDRQLNTIRMIETNINIKFDGETYQDAWKFINENMEISKQARLRQRAERDCRLDRLDISSGVNSLMRHLDSISSKHCDLFSDEDMEDCFF